MLCTGDPDKRVRDHMSDPRVQRRVKLYDTASFSVRIHNGGILTSLFVSFRSCGASDFLSVGIMMMFTFPFGVLMLFFFVRSCGGYLQCQFCQATL